MDEHLNKRPERKTGFLKSVLHHYNNILRRYSERKERIRMTNLIYVVGQSLSRINNELITQGKDTSSIRRFFTYEFSGVIHPTDIETGSEERAKKIIYEKIEHKGMEELKEFMFNFINTYATIFSEHGDENIYSNVIKAEFYRFNREFIYLSDKEFRNIEDTLINVAKIRIERLIINEHNIDGAYDKLMENFDDLTKGILYLNTLRIKEDDKIKVRNRIKLIREELLMNFKKVIFIALQHKLTK